MDGALVVMAKKPTVGETKTRLCPPLTPKAAADLYRCLLLDTLALMSQLEDVQPIVAHLPADSGRFFRRIAPPGFRFVRQVGADLGERLDNVVQHCLLEGYQKVVVIDSDSPTLPKSYLCSAFRALDESNVDVVLGPCDDGGYYLIGLKSPQATLFRGIVMSTSTVAAETVERATSQGLQTHCLPNWYDVDTAEDLERLVAELRSQAQHQASQTRAFLSQELDRL